MIVLLFVALWFILRGDLFYVLLYVILVLCFSVLLALLLPRLGKIELSALCVSDVCSICACLVLSVSSSSWCLERAAIYNYTRKSCFHFYNIILVISVNRLHCKKSS